MIALCPLGARGGESPPVADSDSIAVAINSAHEAAFGSYREALEHARRAGDLLVDAKATVGHGAWLPWVEKNLRFSARTATGYMQIAARWSELESATVADLTLRGALKLLSAPKTRPVPIAAQVTAGHRAEVPPIVHNRDLDGGEAVEVDQRERPDDTDPGMAWALRCQPDLAALLSAWDGASMNARERFVEIRGAEIRAEFRALKAAT
jgi:hypothetical protein